MSNLLKNLLIVLGLSIALFIGYQFFLSGASDVPEGTLGLVEGDVNMHTQDLLRKHEQLNELKERTQTDLFTRPVFTSLIDFRIDLGTEESGRDNPFAPI